MLLHHHLLRDCTELADDMMLFASSYIVELDGPFDICDVAPSYTAEPVPLFEIVSNYNTGMQWLHPCREKFPVLGWG